MLQDYEPIAYESKKLSDAERNYPTHDKEILAIIHALKLWKHYLMDVYFEVYSDHRSLVNFIEQKDLKQKTNQTKPIIGRI